MINKLQPFQASKGKADESLDHMGGAPSNGWTANRQRTDGNSNDSSNMRVATQKLSHCSRSAGLNDKSLSSSAEQHGSDPQNIVGGSSVILNATSQQIFETKSSVLLTHFQSLSGLGGEGHTHEDASSPKLQKLPNCTTHDTLLSSEVILSSVDTNGGSLLKQTYHH